MRKRFIHILWALLGAGILFCILGFVAVWNGLIGYMPEIEDLQNPINRFATQVYSSDGKVLGTWNLNKENRIVIPYDKMSPHLVEALVATEDRHDRGSPTLLDSGRCHGRRSVPEHDGSDY